MSPAITVRRPGVGAVLALLLGILALFPASGCTSEEDRLRAIAVTARTNRGAGAAALVEAYRAKQVRHDTAIGYATRMLQEGKDETALGGAVLDFMDRVKGDFKADSEYELFWMGVGRLAFWSAHVAYANGRAEEALGLVFAGPQRWQVESYWLMYPDHDALASFILDSAGKHGEAVARLRDRSELFGEAEAALDVLTRGAR